MTAMNAFARSTGAYLIADTARYRHDGTVVGFAEKVVTDARLRMMIGCCGRVGHYAEDRIERWLAAQPDQLTAFARLSALLCELADDAGEHDAATGPIPDGIRLTVAWWADREARGRCAIMASNDALAGGAQPFALRDVGTMFMPALGDCNPWPGHSFDPEAEGLALAEHQRAVDFAAGHTHVGGQAILYRVDANGITSRELCRWPDRIGRPIKVTA